MNVIDQLWDEGREIWSRNGSCLQFCQCWEEPQPDSEVVDGKMLSLERGIEREKLDDFL